MDWSARIVIPLRIDNPCPAYYPTNRVINNTKKEKDTMSSYPKLWAPFQLTMDGDDPDFRSIPLVRFFGRTDPEKWKYRGNLFPGIIQRWFQLVEVGSWRNWRDLVGEFTTKYSPAPSGLWIKSFKVEYPDPDYRAPIVVLDAAWNNTEGNSCYPRIARDGKLDFLPTNKKISGIPRCLAFAKEP